MFRIDREEFLAGLKLLTELENSTIRVYPDPYRDTVSLNTYAGAGVNLVVTIYTDYLDYTHPFNLYEQTKDLIAKLSKADCGLVEIDNDLDGILTVCDEDEDLDLQYKVDIDRDYEADYWGDGKIPLCFTSATAVKNLINCYLEEDEELHIELPIQRLQLTKNTPDGVITLLEESAFAPYERFQLEIPSTVIELLRELTFSREVAFHYWDGNLAFAGDTDRGVHCAVVWPACVVS